MHCYIIESNIVIDHKSKTFLNHIEQKIVDGIDFTLSMKESIVPHCHKIFSVRNRYPLTFLWPIQSLSSFELVTLFNTFFKI